MRHVKTENNQFCGPAVISILTGYGTDHCANVISSVTGRTNIQAVSVPEILRVLDKLRFRYDQVESGCSLYSLIIRINRTDGMYIVTVPRHVVALEVKAGIVYFCDNHTREPINAGASARLSQWVDTCFRTEARPDPVFVTSTIEVKPNLQGIEVFRNNYFVNKEDDDCKLLGTIWSRDTEERKKIVMKMLEVV